MPESVVVGLFERESNAREFADAARSLGVAEESFGVLSPGQRLSSSNSSADLLSTTAATRQLHDVPTVLTTLGVADGEARFYADEARQGRTLVVVDANGHHAEVRQLVLDHGGYDVQSRGRDVIRPAASGVPGGVGALPPDVTANWEDFRSRYQMLWQQHYGTTDATWEQMEPTYRYAWTLANRPDLRGRPWAEAEAAVERDWQASEFSRGTPWSEAAGPLRDVWEDVAEEAATGAEGGAARRIASAGTDQSVAARSLEPPTRGAS
jgi:hypothetical protein